MRQRGGIEAIVVKRKNHGHRRGEDAGSGDWIVLVWLDASPIEVASLWLKPFVSRADVFVYIQPCPGRILIMHIALHY